MSKPVYKADLKSTDGNGYKSTFYFAEKEEHKKKAKICKFSFGQVSVMRCGRGCLF